MNSAPTTLDPAAGLVTVINTYLVAPERAQDLLELLLRATHETLRHVPGFVSANFHVDDERRRIVNYAQWTSREAIAAARVDPQVVARIAQAGALAESFAPVVYELRRSVAAAGGWGRIRAGLPCSSRCRTAPCASCPW